MPFQGLTQDIRYAFRQLRQAPAFTLTAVVTLALGIGANTAIFSLVHAVMLKSLPVSKPGQLYRVGDTADCCVTGGLQDDWTIFSYSLYQHFRDHSAGFEQLAASQTNRPYVSVRRGSAPAEAVVSEMVSGNYFSTLGLGAMAGRMIEPSDDQPGAPLAAVISYRAWEQRYGMDPSIVGGSITINQHPATIVGVAPAGFFGDRLESDPPDCWLPLAAEPTLTGGNSLLRQADVHWLYLIGRLLPGAQPSQMQEQMTVQLRAWLNVPGNIGQPQSAEQIGKQVVRLAPGSTGVNVLKQEFERGLYLLMAASGLVLIIACANLANLLLARGTATRFRTSLQLAVGATRGRIVRGKLAESLMLAGAGGAAGLLVAFYATRAILAIAFRGSHYVPISASPSLPLLEFTFAVALVTGTVFGAGPAWIVSRADPAEVLRGAGRSTRRESSLPQRSLIVLQAALSLVLLAVAGLVTRSLRNLEQQELGFQKQSRILISVNTLAAGYTPERVIPLYQQITERFAQSPGVTGASASLYAPQQGNNWSEIIYISGHSGQEREASSWNRVTAGYFETIGTPILRGRGITRGDTATSQHIAVVSETFAARYFPQQEVLGQHFGKGDSSHAGDYEIVGVVKDSKYQNPAEPVRPMFFVPLPQVVSYKVKADATTEARSLYLDTIELHVASARGSFDSLVRQTLAGIDPGLTPIQILTYDEQVALQTNREMLISRLSDLFGLLALLLASVGLYGVTAYRVARRTGEMGVRMALGANRRDIVALVLRGAFSQIGLGLAIGLPLVLVAGRLLRSQLFGVGSFDPWILGGSVFMLSFCALVASAVPAQRAAAIDPMKALRTE